jgi:hypothetical protein
MALRNPSKRHLDWGFVLTDLRAMKSICCPVSQAGPTGAFWNPATAERVPGALRAGVQMLHMPDAVGLTGVLGGLGYSIAGTAIAL